MNVVVVGAGKMGLPLAAQLARNGARVVACDIRPEVVEAINRGQCPIDEPGVAELVEATVRSRHLSASTAVTAAAAQSDVVIVIVPVLLSPDRDADLSTIEAVSRQIAQGLHPGMMISYETTLPVGSCRRLVSILESSGLKAGADFDVVFSPERVKSQLVLQNLTKNPKIVGGLTPQSAARGAAFYEKYLGAPVINVGSLEAAELVKLAGMLYRDVNIALANELARYAEAAGIDFPPIIAAANTDGEAALLWPGIGVGGHCTPVYPYFGIRDGQRRGIPLTLAERARQINDDQPRHILDRLERTWGPLAGKTALILGLGFRPQVKEHIFSPAFQLGAELRRRKVAVQLHDPLYSAAEIEAHGFTPGSLEATPGAQVLILNTSHDAYAHLNFSELAARGLQAVVDGRALWPPEVVRGAGLVYVGVARPDEPVSAPKKAALPIARPLLGAEEANAAAQVVRSGWVLQGPQVESFEREFAAYVGAAHACAVSSGTTALHLALLGVGVRPGDEVITVSHSFIATANAIRYCGATPVFVDIEPGTYNLDPAKLAPAISPRTRAILCVHQSGMPCNLAEIVAFARRHNLAVVEDAANAIGSEIRWQGQWQLVGKPHAQVACFSFHPRKVITTGEGGMLTTADAELDRRFRLWRNHGMSVSAAARHGAREVIFESYPVLGYNYRLTDIQAAVGREQLLRLPQLLEERRRLAGRYREMLSDITGLGLPLEPSWARSNWQSFCVRLPQGASQRQVMQYLLDRGVATRRGVMCAHREASFQEISGAISLPESERAQDGCLLLPLFPGMTDQDLTLVVAELAQALKVS
jgi:nucleotide sugar dehydrogenase